MSYDTAFKSMDTLYEAVSASIAGYYTGSTAFTAEQIHNLGVTMQDFGKPRF
jgi:hypothetical protein